MQSLFLLVLLALAGSTFASPLHDSNVPRILQRASSQSPSRPSHDTARVARRSEGDSADEDVRLQYQRFLSLAVASQAPDSTGCASQCLQIVGSMDDCRTASHSYDAYNRCSCGSNVLIQASNCSSCLGTTWNSAELDYTDLCQRMFNASLVAQNATASTIPKTGAASFARGNPISPAAVAGTSTLLLLGALALLGAA